MVFQSEEVDCEEDEPSLFSPIRLTVGLTLVFLFLEHPSTLPVARLLLRRFSSSSQILMHQLSAQEIHVRLTRFLRPLRTLRSMFVKDPLEREKEDRVEVTDCEAEGGSMSISIRIERPCHE